MTIHVDMILYLSLYYLVNDLVHLPNPTMTLPHPLRTDVHDRFPLSTLTFSWLLRY